MKNAHEDDARAKRVPTVKLKRACECYAGKNRRHLLAFPVFSPLSSLATVLMLLHMCINNHSMFNGVKKGSIKLNEHLTHICNSHKRKNPFNEIAAIVYRVIKSNEPKYNVLLSRQTNFDQLKRSIIIS